MLLGGWIGVAFARGWSKLGEDLLQTRLPCLFDKPGVAGAVLQTASLLTHSQVIFLNKHHMSDTGSVKSTISMLL